MRGPATLRLAGAGPSGEEGEPLALRAELALEAVRPFHFAGTVFKPSHFPTSDVAFDGVCQRRTLRLGGELMGVALRAAGGARRPAVHVALHGRRRLPAGLVARVREELAFRLDLGTDLRDFERSCGRDRLLAPVLERWSGMRPSAGQSLYEFLAITTVLQNTVVRRSVQMMAALFGRLGRRVVVDGVPLDGFWDPRDLDALPEAELRALKE